MKMITNKLRCQADCGCGQRSHAIRDAVAAKVWNSTGLVIIGAWHVKKVLKSAWYSNWSRVIASTVVALVLCNGSWVAVAVIAGVLFALLVRVRPL